jgi:hypothetical protein
MSVMSSQTNEYKFSRGTLTLPLLRNGPLPLPQAGEGQFISVALYLPARPNCSRSFTFARSSVRRRVALRVLPARLM